MWSPEDLARIRCQEAIADAYRQRLARRFTAGRAWRRLAHFAFDRADRLSRTYADP